MPKQACAMLLSHAFPSSFVHLRSAFRSSRTLSPPITKNTFSISCRRQGRWYEDAPTKRALNRGLVASVDKNRRLSFTHSWSGPRAPLARCHRGILCRRPSLATSCPVAVAPGMLAVCFLENLPFLMAPAVSSGVTFSNFGWAEKSRAGRDGTGAVRWRPDHLGGQIGPMSWPRRVWRGSRGGLAACCPSRSGLPETSWNFGVKMRRRGCGSLATQSRWRLGLHKLLLAPVFVVCRLALCRDYFLWRKAE